GQGLDIFDNDTDLITVGYIGPGATYTIETGLDPNTSYRRYIKGYTSGAQNYYYIENTSETTGDQFAWYTAVQLNLGVLPGGDNYFVIATAQYKLDCTTDHSRSINIFLTRREDGSSDYDKITLKEWTDNQYRSFMGTDAITADGVTSYDYRIRFYPQTADTFATVQNAAILVIRIDPSMNYSQMENSTEVAIQTTSWTKHSGLNISAATASDFLIFHRSRYKFESTTSNGGYSRLYFTEQSREMSYIYRNPRNTQSDQWYLNGGFSLLKGITTATLEDQHKGSSASFNSREREVSIAAIRTDHDAFYGYEYEHEPLEIGTTSTSWQDAITKDVEVPVTQDYVIMASCSLGIPDTTGSYYAEATLYVDGSYYNTMRFYPNYNNDERATFAAMRKIQLSAGTRTVGIRYRTSDGSRTAYTLYRNILAIPLTGFSKVFTNPSNSVEACTLAAVPEMCNSAMTFIYENSNTIRAQVFRSANLNPGGTPLQLFWTTDDNGAPDDSNWTALSIETSTPIWDVGGLNNNSVYWFKARARNWSGYWTDNCAVVRWHTTGMPTLSCLDCTTETLTWGWDAIGLDGFDIFNGSDMVVIADISPGSTYTIETGLSPNTSYSRYIVPYRNLPLPYRYDEQAKDIVGENEFSWKESMRLRLGQPRAGDYLIFTAGQVRTNTPVSDKRQWVRLRRDTSEIQVAQEWTGDHYRSFMHARVLSNPGGAWDWYDMQFAPTSAGHWIYVKNSAMIAIRIEPDAMDFSYNDNDTETQQQVSSWTKHSGLDISAPSATDFLVIQRSQYRWAGDANGDGMSSRLYSSTVSDGMNYCRRDPPGSWNQYIQGGFIPLAGVTSATLEDQFMGSSTTYNSIEAQVLIAAMRLDGTLWNGSDFNRTQGNVATTSTTWADAVTKDISVSTTQKYLVMASGSLGLSTSSPDFYVEAALFADGVYYDTMKFTRTPNSTIAERAAFTAMKRIELAAGTRTVALRFRVSDSSITGRVEHPAIVAIPLEGTYRQYLDCSAEIEVCTWANIPYMDNTTDTFTGQTDITITAQVGDNGNPGGTTIELLYAKGDPSGPTEAFSSAGTLTSTYEWQVPDLEPNTSYWFKARAQNWSGIWTDNCAITVWSTIGPPTNFRCIDCSSTTLSWAWDFTWTCKGFEIFDNDTGASVLADIDNTATYTIESGLAPNTSYNRHIKYYSGAPLQYLYAVNPSEVWQNEYAWKTAVTLSMGVIPSGEEWLVMGTAQFKMDNENNARRTIIGLVRIAAVETTQDEWTDRQFRSFMASEVVTGDGSTNYYYRIMFYPSTDGRWAVVQNAAICAIRIDPAWNFDYNDNSADYELATTSWTKHSELSISSASPADFLIVHRSSSRFESAALSGVYSRLYSSSLGELGYAQNDPANPNYWFLQGGFVPLSSITSATLEDQFKGSSSSVDAHEQHVHIAALALDNEVWDGYAYNWTAGEGALPDTTWRYAEYVDVSVPRTGNYLILGSTALKYNDTTGNECVEAKLHADGTGYLDHMQWYPVDKTDDYTNFAAMKKVTLAAGTQRVSVQARSSSDSIAGSVKYRSIIALPLSGSMAYSSPSNSEVAFTAAEIPGAFAGTFNDSGIELTWDNGYVTATPGNPDYTTYYLEFDTDLDNDWADGFEESVDNSTSMSFMHNDNIYSDTTHYYRTKARNYIGCDTEWTYCEVKAAVATTFYWRGTTDTNWNEDTNWWPRPKFIIDSGVTVVGDGNNNNCSVVIEASTNMPSIPAGGLTIKNLVISGGNTCTFAGAGTIQVTGNVSGTGTLNITGAGAVLDSDGEFDVDTLLMTNGDIFIGDNDPTITTFNCTGGTVTYDDSTSVPAMPAGNYNNLIIDKNPIPMDDIGLGNYMEGDPNKRPVLEITYNDNQMENCGASWSGYMQNHGVWQRVGGTIRFGNESDWDFFYGSAKFGLDNITGPVDVTRVKLYYYVWSGSWNPGERFNVSKLTSDPQTTDPAVIANAIDNATTLFKENCTELAQSEYLSITLNDEATQWLEEAINNSYDCCSIGFKLLDTSASYVNLQNDTADIDGDFTIKSGEFMLTGNSALVECDGKLIGAFQGYTGKMSFNGSNTFPKVNCSAFEFGNDFLVSGYNGYLNAWDAGLTSFLDDASISLEDSLKLYASGNFEMRNTGGTSAEIEVTGQTDNESFLISVGKNFTMTNTSLISALAGKPGDHGGNAALVSAVGGGGGAYWGQGGNSALASFDNGGIGADQYRPADWWTKPMEMGSEGGDGFGALIFFNGFEGGNMDGWVQNGGTLFTASQNDSHTGSYCAESYNWGGGGSASSFACEAFIVPERGATMTFWWKLTAGGPPESDWIAFWLYQGFTWGDNEAMLFGQTAWSQLTYTMPKGENKFFWVFDDEWLHDDQKGFVDDITVTAHGAAGGKGGGAIRVVCGGVFTIAGTLSAQGEDGGNDPIFGSGGGGAGGFIYVNLTCSTAGDHFVRTGSLITVRGGDGGLAGDNDSAGGGGGAGLLFLESAVPGSFSYADINGNGDGTSLLGLGGGLGGPLPAGYPLDNTWDEEYLGGDGTAHIEDGTNEVTFVRLYDLRAVGYDTGIAVLWRSGLELDHAWYNVHRADSANGTYAADNGPRDNFHRRQLLLHRRDRRAG
ncbi:MAG: carbohydrate-binding protein, partial [Planctomycetota bacterium]